MIGLNKRTRKRLEECAMDQLEEARSDYIESLAETMRMYGLSPSMGRLFGIMFFHQEPMTLDEMRQRTGMSKTSMSTGVRELSRLKLVQKKWIKGVRKDLYQAEQDQFRSFIEFFVHLWETEIELNEKALRASEEKLTKLLHDSGVKNEEKKQVEQDLEKLANAKRYYAWLRQLANTFKSGEIFDFVPVPGESPRK
jgi:DNA-binding transcriptional regulator GbsR (MarR family)